MFVFCFWDERLDGVSPAESRLRSNFFFIVLADVKSISLYETPFTDVGRSQYDFSSVTVFESLNFTLASTAKSNAATWVHVSPRPAMHVQ
jgi:hypothetical protein